MRSIIITFIIKTFSRNVIKQENVEVTAGAATTYCLKRKL